jgi:hypothetical protein
MGGKLHGDLRKCAKTVGAGKTIIQRDINETT